MKKTLRVFLFSITLFCLIFFHMNTATAANINMYIDTPTAGSYMTKQMAISGWAINNSGVKKAEVYIDDNYIGAATLGGYRSDVAAAYPNIAKNCISTYTMTANLKLSDYSIGTHTLKVVATSNDGTTSATSTSIINLSPIMYIDLPLSTYSNDGNNKITVKGWALAPDGVKNVAINIDGSSDPSLCTNIAAASLLSRIDVLKVYSSYPGLSLNKNCGFSQDFSISKLSLGTHTANIIITTNDGNTITSSKSFTIEKAKSYMYIDSPIDGSNMTEDLEIRGWAIDASTVKSVDMYLADKLLGSATITEYRSDVAAAFPTYSTSQISTFNYTTKIDLNDYAFGSNQLKVVVTGLDGSTTTQSTNLINVAPIIYYDSPTNYNSGTDDNVSIYGWAIARDGIKSVTIDVDSSTDPTLCTTIDSSALTERTDVQRVFASYPGISLNKYSGFKTNFDISKISAGTHTINTTITTNSGKTYTQSKMVTVTKPDNIMYVDNPIFGQNMVSSMQVKGWAINTSSVKSVEIYIDGGKVGTAELNSNRDDVAKAYPEYRKSYISGFTGNISLNLSDYSYGNHTMNIVATGFDGSTTSQATNIVNVTPIIYYDSPTNYNSKTISTVSVYGWAIASDGIKNVTIDVDGSTDPSLCSTIGSSALTLRTDVQMVYASYPGIELNKNSGFSVNFDINKISAGTHTINTTVVTNNGKKYTQEKTITVTKLANLMYIDKPTYGQYMTSSMEVKGWAINSSTVKSADIYIDGTKVSSASLSEGRSDVYAAYPNYKKSCISSFSANINLNLTDYSYGNHTMSVVATGVDGSTTTQSTNLVNAEPIIYYDSPTNYNSGTDDNVSIYGWAIARDGIKSVTIDVDSSTDPTLCTTIDSSALTERTDVQRVFASYPGISLNKYSGFKAFFDINKISAGTHTINATIVTNNGITYTQKKTITITKPANMTYIDKPTYVQYMTSSMDVKGWAINASTVKTVDIYIDGTKIKTATLDSTRADVSAAFPSYRKSEVSGFSATISLNVCDYTLGNHTLTIVATGIDGSTSSQSVVICKPNPIMCVDSPNCTTSYYKGSIITIRGWALNASTVTSVTVAIDGVAQDVTFAINRSSDDVYNVYPNYPYSNNARFTGTFTMPELTEGLHTFSVTANGADGTTQTYNVTITFDGLTYPTSYNISLSSMLTYQQTSYNNAAICLNDLDPSIIINYYGGFEFLNLKYTTSNITAAQLNVLLQGKGVLEGHGADFLEAANTYGINPLYLIAHARLETGNGTSTLSKGQVYPGTDTKYYNMFGIGAYDGVADSAGLAAAYKYGWDSVSKAIIGGSGWIAKNYVNSVWINRSDGKVHYDQDTLYEMKWDPYAVSLSKTPYRYATDPGWAYKIAGIMYNDYCKLSNTGMVLRFDIPSYSGN